MKKIKEVIGLPVLSKQRKRIGYIKDVIINRKQKTLVGFMLERKNTEISKKAIPFTDIQDFCADHIRLKEIKNVIKWKEFKGNLEKACSEGFCDLDIIAEDGKKIGSVCDMLFDTEDGQIRELVISDGLMEDMWRGRQRMPVLNSVEFADELIIADSEAVEEMSRSGKGIKAILQQMEES